MFHLKKGTYEYYKKKTRSVVLLTIVYFAISISLFIVGYVTTKTRANLLTIVAVLGLLPASKSLVSMIMYLRYHGCDKETYMRIRDKLTSFLCGYGFVFTTYKLNFEVCCCVVKNGYIYGLLTNHVLQAKELEEHITAIMKQNGLKVKTVLFLKEDELIKRCDEIVEKSDENPSADASIMEVLCDISL